MTIEQKQRETILWEETMKLFQRIDALQNCKIEGTTELRMKLIMRLRQLIRELNNANH